MQGAIDIAAAAYTGYTTQSQLNNSGAPATTAYVDLAVSNAVAGVNPATSVNAATIQASDTSGLTYANGVSGIGATLTGIANTAITIDGFTFTAIGQRLLVKNDTQSPSGAFNGVYTLTVLQILAVAPVFTRALDYDTPSDINNVGAIPVISGTVNTNTSWLQTSNIVTVGTTPLTYVQFSYAPSTVQKGTYATKPGSPVAGQQYFATDLGVNGLTLVYSGSIWKPAAGSAVLICDPAAHTAAGNASETNYAVVTIPAGLVSANGSLRIYAQGSYTGTTGTKSILIRHNTSSAAVSGGSLLVSSSNGGSNTALSANSAKVLMNVASQSAQIFLPNGTNSYGGASSSTALQTGSINMANASYLNFNIIGNASDTVGYQGIIVEWIEP